MLRIKNVDSLGKGKLSTCVVFEENCVLGTMIFGGRYPSPLISVYMR